MCRSLGNGLFDCRNVRDAGTGLNDTDVVIYVQSVNLAGCASNALIAFGQTCQLDAVTDRPVAGCLNICPSSIAALSNAKGAKLTPYAHYSNYSTATNGLDNEEQVSDFRWYTFKIQFPIEVLRGKVTSSVSRFCWAHISIFRSRLEMLGVLKTLPIFITFLLQFKLTF